MSGKGKGRGTAHEGTALLGSGINDEVEVHSRRPALGAKRGAKRGVNLSSRLAASISSSRNLVALVAMLLIGILTALLLRFVPPTRRSTTTGDPGCTKATQALGIDRCLENGPGKDNPPYFPCNGFLPNINTTLGTLNSTLCAALPTMQPSDFQYCVRVCCDLACDLLSITNTESNQKKYLSLILPLVLTLLVGGGYWLAGRRRAEIGETALSLLPPADPVVPVPAADPAAADPVLSPVTERRGKKPAGAVSVLTGRDANRASFDPANRAITREAGLAITGTGNPGASSSVGGVHTGAPEDLFTAAAEDLEKIAQHRLAASVTHLFKGKGHGNSGAGPSTRGRRSSLSPQSSDTD